MVLGNRRDSLTGKLAVTCQTWPGIAILVCPGSLWSNGERNYPPGQDYLKGENRSYTNIVKSELNWSPGDRSLDPLSVSVTTL